MSSILADHMVVVYEPNSGGGGGCMGVTAYKYSFAHGAQVNFGDVTQYLTLV
jgi:hypothetical protein